MISATQRKPQASLSWVVPVIFLIPTADAFFCPFPVMLQLLHWDILVPAIQAFRLVYVSADTFWGIGKLPDPWLSIYLTKQAGQIHSFFPLFFFFFTVLALLEDWWHFQRFSICSLLFYIYSFF